MIFNIPLFAAFLVSMPTLSKASSSKMDFKPFANVRTDPIISQSCLSDHVHTFYGAQTVRPEVTYNDLINMPKEKNSGNVEENMSLYWHPSIYAYHPLNNSYTRQDVGFGSAYYIWRTGEVKAFPPGFRMIAGNNPDAPGNFPDVGSGCANERPCERDDGCGEEVSDVFTNNQCDELEVSMNFPVCWDGRLDSPDHQSHMAYALDGKFDGPCPPTHQAGRFPQIQFFFRILNYIGGPHVFSDGTDIYHADYISGWNETFLQSVLDTCVTDSFDSNPESWCEDFLTFKDAPKDMFDISEAEFAKKLEIFQPPPLDVKSTVAPEDVDVVVGGLPRGACNGVLIDPVPGGGSNPAPSPVAGSNPTPAPVAASNPTFAPVGSDPASAPTAESGDDDDDDDDDEEGSNQQSGDDDDDDNDEKGSGDDDDDDDDEGETRTSGSRFDVKSGVGSNQTSGIASIWILMATVFVVVVMEMDIMNSLWIGHL